MSEEEVSTEVAPTEPEAETQEGSGNPVFDALFKTVESEPEFEPDELEHEPPRMTSLHATLHEIENETPEEGQPEEPVESGSTDNATVVDSPKPKVGVKRKVVDPEFKSPRQRRMVAAPPQVDPFEAELNDEEKGRLELARWAAGNVKDQKELPKQYMNFFKEHKKYIGERLQVDPDHDLSNDEDYKRFVESKRPRINVKQLETERLTRNAEDRALQRMAPEIKRLQREQVKTRNAPLASEGMSAAKKLMEEAVPEEMRKSLSTNPEEYSAKNPFEVNIVNQTISNGLVLSQAFNDILYEMDDYNEQNPTHKALSEFIDEEQTRFIQTGRTKRNGKTFVRRERFPSVPEGEQEQYYTFTDADVLRLLATRTKEHVDNQLTNLRSQFDQAGYKRDGIPTETARAQIPQPVTAQQGMNRPIQPKQSAGTAMPSAADGTPEKSTLFSLLGL
jgi:hypothetical protein